MPKIAWVESWVPTEISCSAEAHVFHILVHRKLQSLYRFALRTNNAGAAAQLPGCETDADMKETSRSQFRSSVIAPLPGMGYEWL
eukprot:s178_g25.t1